MTCMRCRTPPWPLTPAPPAPPRRRCVQIQNAISRQRKEETVEQLEGLLQSSAVVVGLRYQGLTVKQLQEFRRSLPQESKMLVCKVRPTVGRVQPLPNG